MDHNLLQELLDGKKANKQNPHAKIRSKLRAVIERKRDYAFEILKVDAVTLQVRFFSQGASFLTPYQLSELPRIVNEVAQCVKYSVESKGSLVEGDKTRKVIYEFRKN